MSIPSSYTSYLAPLSSLKLHNEVRALGETTASMETPYVVKIHRGYLISKPVACFTFTHPDKEVSVLGHVSARHGIERYFSKEREKQFL